MSTWENRPNKAKVRQLRKAKPFFELSPETTWPPIPALIAAWKTIQWATPPYWDYPQTVHQVSALFELMDVNPTVEGVFLGHGKYAGPCCWRNMTPQYFYFLSNLMWVIWATWQKLELSELLQIIQRIIRCNLILIDPWRIFATSKLEAHSAEADASVLEVINRRASGLFTLLCMCFLFLDALFFWCLFWFILCVFCSLMLSFFWCLLGFILKIFDNWFAVCEKYSYQQPGLPFFWGKFPGFRCRRKREAVDDTFQALKEAVWWTRP